MLPSKAAKQNRDLIPFLGRKRPFDGTVKMCGLVQTSDLAEPVALGLQALLDFFVIVDLNKIGRHYLPPAYAVFWGFGKRTRTDQRLSELSWQRLEKQRLENRRPARRPSPLAERFGTWDVGPPETPKTCYGGSMFYARREPFKTNLDKAPD
jgi:hypothetical protein